MPPPKKKCPAVKVKVAVDAASAVKLLCCMITLKKKKKKEIEEQFSIAVDFFPCQGMTCLCT